MYCLHPDYSNNLNDSPEDLQCLHDSLRDDSSKLIDCFSPLLEETQDALERQVNSIRQIADHAKEQAQASSLLASESRSQTALLQQQVTTLEKQLKVAKEAAEAAEKEAFFAKWTSILSIGISIGSIIVPIVANIAAH